MMSQGANSFQFLKKKKKTFSEHFNKNQLIYHFNIYIFFLLLEQKNIVAKM